MQAGDRRKLYPRGFHRLPTLAGLALVLVFGPALTAAHAPAWALSEIQRDDLPPGSSTPDANASPGLSTPGTGIPAPNLTQPTTPDDDEPEDDDGGSSEVGRPDVDPEAPLPEIIYNLDRLPETVRRMHDKLLEAAKSGDVEALRPLLQTGEDGTQLSFGGVDGDPIAFIKGLSGDPEGQEILAIMEEVLNAGFVHLDAGQPNELYVWPYFFAMPLDKLDKRQRVELFKIVTAGDYEDMKQFGTYVFYRLGIDPDGRWLFFVAGD